MIPMHRRAPVWFPFASSLVAFLFSLPSVALAQPTYKLEVKPDLKPLVTLQLDGGRHSRSNEKEAPGFRLQYHFKKDGKTAPTTDARANPAVEVPRKEAGTYSVVLELFYPTYKGGNQPKGEF